MKPVQIHKKTLAVEESLVESWDTAELTVGQVYRPDTVTCSPDLPVSEAAREMSRAGSSAILVVDGDRTVGIWTERDALALDLGDPQTFARPIRSIMSTPVRSVQPHVPLSEVAGRFREEKLRHLVVVDERGKRLGLISQTEVVLNQGVEHYMRLRQVKAVLRGSLLIVAETASVSEAARLMRNEGRDAVIVGYDNGNYGILTERDLIRLVARQRAGELVGTVASRPLIAVDEESSLYRARTLLLESRIRHIGVMQENQIIGVVSFSDIVAGMELAYVHELRLALKERNRALKISRHSLRLAEKVIESSPEGILITDQNGLIESVNPAFTTLTGFTQEEVIGKTPAVLSSGRHDKAFYEAMWRKLAHDGHWQGEIWNRRKTGEVYPELLTITAISDESGCISHYAALFTDISRLKENEERIRHLAYYDPLTGLPNRRLFSDRLSVAIAHAHRNERQLAVMFVDLDRFKRVNDSLGHSIGDRLLQVVAERIRGSVREDDTVARMGGDEFIILLSEVASFDEAAHCARQLVEVVTAPIDADGEELIVTCSIGVSFYPDDGLTEEDLIKNADTAMYRAKEGGRNNFQLYMPAMNALSLEHLAMEIGLRKALERNEFRVHYQPIIDIRTGELLGAEALLRWDHPELGLVPPADFIPLAEETGLVSPMGEWVMGEVCRQVKQWQAQGYGLVRTGINISACQFREARFLERLRKMIKSQRMDPCLLNLEMTESLLMEDGVEVIRMLQQIREMGVGISVDDFGTGYSSLSYLKRFPINTLKIDRSFVRDIAVSREDAAIVSTIIGLAHSLNLTVVAEGVENEEQLALLRERDCDAVQGFFYSRPLPQEQFAEKFLSPRLKAVSEA